MSKAIEALLEGNRRWVEEMTAKDSQFFERMSKGQSPGYLFIGCSDSRVAANQLTRTGPGEMFVHRNIANQYRATDLNCTAVVQFAIEALKVPEIIVCGHFGCGGVKAAAGDEYNGIVDHWLGELRGVLRTYRPVLDRLNAKEQHEKAVELSVLKQVQNLSADPTIRKAWDKGRTPRITGMVYDIANGRLRTVVTDVDSPDKAAGVMPPLSVTIAA